MIMQGLFGAITGGIFLYYTYSVEKEVKCFSNGQGIASPIPFDENWTDVSKAFHVVIQAYGILCCLDFLFEMMRVTELFGKLQPLIVTLTLMNLLVGFGFFLAIHIVRFRPSGEICSNIILIERGKLMKYYVIALWSFVGFFLIGMILIIYFIKRKNN